MLAIIVLSLAVPAIAIPSLGLLMLIDVAFHPPRNPEAAEPNVSLGKEGRVGRSQELRKLVAG